MTISSSRSACARASERGRAAGRLLALGLVLPLAAAPLRVEVRDSQGAPVADAVVCLVATGQVAAPAPRKVEIDQVGQEFRPAVAVVPVGSTVLFPNRDVVAHHVYSFSAPCRFDLPLYTGAPPREIRLEQPGVVTLGCNIHDWMVAHLYVTDAPWSALSGADGRAELAEPPPAGGRLRVWHARLRGAEVEQPVDGAATGAVVTLSLRPPQKLRRGPVVGGAGGYR